MHLGKIAYQAKPELQFKYSDQSVKRLSGKGIAFSGVFCFGAISPNDIQSIVSPVVSLDTAANYKLILFV